MLRNNVEHLFKLARMFLLKGLGSFEVLKRLGVRDGYRGLVRKHPQPNGILFLQRIAAENGQNPKNAATYNQWVADETSYFFRERPIRPPDPSTLLGYLCYVNGLPAGSNNGDLAIIQRYSPRLTLQ
jgi:hypothetical protein